MHARNATANTVYNVASWFFFSVWLEGRSRRKAADCQRASEYSFSCLLAVRAIVDLNYFARSRCSRDSWSMHAMCVRARASRCELFWGNNYVKWLHRRNVDMANNRSRNINWAEYVIRMGDGESYDLAGKMSKWWNGKTGPALFREMLFGWYSSSNVAQGFFRFRQWIFLVCRMWWLNNLTSKPWIETWFLLEPSEV